MGVQVSSNRKHDRRFIAVRDLARRRVDAVLACIEVLLPGSDTKRKKKIANRILELCHGQERRREITPAEARDVVLRHVQCVKRDCPLLIFSEPLSRELNRFFEEEE